MPLNFFERFKEKIRPEKKEIPLPPEKEIGKEGIIKVKEKPAEVKYPAVKKAVAPPPLVAKSPTFQEIEIILQEGLEEIYASLDERQQAEFRRKGEETASKIEQLIVTFKTKVKTILKLIRDWLKSIPGVNKFFLEQESKIKTDRIMALAQKEKIKRKYV